MTIYYYTLIFITVTKRPQVILIAQEYKLQGPCDIIYIYTYEGKEEVRHLTLRKIKRGE